MQMSALFGAKTYDLSKFMVCPHEPGGEEVEPVRIFFGKGGEGVNFSRFCADVFHGRPLIQQSYL